MYHSLAAYQAQVPHKQQQQAVEQKRGFFYDRNAETRLFRCFLYYIGVGYVI